MNTEKNGNISIQNNNEELIKSFNDNENNNDNKNIIEDMETTKETNIYHHLKAIDKMINEIREITKKKRIYKSNKEYFPCHFCKDLLEKHYLLHCTKQDCSRYFCLKCVSIRFNKTSQQILDIMKSAKWFCFSCTEECTCRICKMKTAELTLKIVETNLGITMNKDKKATNKNQNKANSEVLSSTSKPDDQSIPTSSGGNIIQDTDSTNIFKSGNEIASNQTAQPSNINSPKNKNTGVIPPNNNISEVKNQIVENKESDMQLSSKEKKMVIEERKIIVEEKLPPRKAKLVGQHLPLLKRGFCHYCNEETNLLECLQCSKKQCKKIYCLICILEHFEKNFDITTICKNTWTCYSCYGRCTCKQCQNPKKNLIGVKKKVQKILNDDYNLQSRRKKVKFDRNENQVLPISQEDTNKIRNTNTMINSINNNNNKSPNKYSVELGNLYNNHNSHSDDEDEDDKKFCTIQNSRYLARKKFLMVNPQAMDKSKNRSESHNEQTHTIHIANVVKKVNLDAETVITIYDADDAEQIKKFELCGSLK